MIVVGTTLAAFVMDQPDTWSAWLRNAAAIQASHPAGVRYFAAVEVDARGIEPFAPLLDRLVDLGGEHWTFMLDDGRTEVTTRSTTMRCPGAASTARGVAITPRRR